MEPMYLHTPNGTRIWTDSNRNFTLREYGRLEYGSPDVAWLVSSVRTKKSRAKRARARRPLRVRLRYFLNSFRGFAAFDLQGPSRD